MSVITIAPSQRVLIVEDDKASQMFQRIVLKQLGVEVDIVGNGMEALKALSRTDYALVLMDCVMPGMGGLEATRSIRSGDSNAFNPNIPIIAITADVRHQNYLACKLAGMNAWLTKPVAPVALKQVVQKWLLPQVSHWEEEESGQPAPKNEWSGLEVFAEGEGHRAAVSIHEDFRIGLRA